MSAETAERVMTMPSLGADMDFGTVVEWRVSTGDTVAKGDIVAVVETEKSDIDIETWHAGTVTELLAEVGRELPVGAPLLRMTDDASAPSPQHPEPEEPATEQLSSELPAQPTATAMPPQPVAAEAEAPRMVPPKPSTAGVLASPRARLAAHERGVDLATVVGTGPGGAVLFGDVERAGDSGRVSHGVTEHPASDRQTSMRRSIAERMARANSDIPHYYLESDVDLSVALANLERSNEAKPLAERIIPAALLIEAAAQAAKKHPECVGTWTDDGFQPADRIDVGIAISLRRGGLVTPTITRADERTIEELMAALKELVGGARAGSLRSSWMADAGITVTNLGDNGAARMQGVIFPPQVSLVGFGRIEKRPWVVDDRILVRPMVSVSFAGDHRATDGLTGSRFLSTLAKHLEQSEF